MTNVSICLVSFRNTGDVLKCIRALAGSDYAKFNVVIVENGGQIAYEQLCNSLPFCMPGGQRITVLCALSNIGYAGGVNACIRATPASDAWWILNPDTEPHANALGAFVTRLEAGDCDLVGGILVDEMLSHVSLGGRWLGWLGRTERLEPKHFGLNLEPSIVEARLSYVSGASLLVSTRFVATVGPMREDYFLYCEEVEWCLRGSKAGMCIGFAPAAVVVHRQGTTTGSSSNIALASKTAIHLDERNKILLVRDHTPWRLPVVAIATLFQIGVRFGKRFAWLRMIYALQGWWAGIRDRRGRPHWIQKL